MADQLITDEDLVALYCGDAGSTRAASYKYDAWSRSNTLTRGTSPPWDVADIYPIAVKSLLNTQTFKTQIYTV